MTPEIATRLLELNRAFYHNLGLSFSQTRQRLQPGVKHLINSIPSTASILDLGCGNGEVARELSRNHHHGNYTGIDSSQPLLQEAQQHSQPGFRVSFAQADLSISGWETTLTDSPYDIILAFAVLHHIPSKPLRTQVIQTVHNLLAPNGLFFHSHWQPLHSPRLRARLQPWQIIGFSSTDVDPGDWLLDWRRDGYGLRYVHISTPIELSELASESGFTVLDTFTSDGKEGRLGVYQVWKPKQECG